MRLAALLFSSARAAKNSISARRAFHCCRQLNVVESVGGKKAGRYSKGSLQRPCPGQVSKVPISKCPRRCLCPVVNSGGLPASSRAAKNVCHVGVEVEVGEEGAAIAFIRFSTTAAISAVHLSLSCLPRSNVLSTGRCTSGMVAKHRCTSALMAKRRPSGLEANLFATWPPATRMRRQAVRKRWAVQHHLVPKRAVLQR